MQVMGDTVRSPFRHDAAALPIPAPPPAPMFRGMAPTGRWDAGMVFKASLQTGALCAMFTVPLTFPGWIPWYTPAAVLLMVPLPTWLGLSLWPRSVMSIIEKVVNQDLNGDNRIGNEEVELLPVKIEFHDTHSNRTVLDELPRRKGHPNGPFIFARAILDERATFCEADAQKYAGLTRKQWRQQSPDDKLGWVDVFLNHGWAIDRGGRQGIELLERGDAVIEMLAHTEQ